MTVGVVTFPVYSAVHAAINEARIMSPGIARLPGYRPELLPEMVDEVLDCPECGIDRELVVTGRWGEPAVIRCPAGHRWTPAPNDPDRAIRFPKAAIASTPEAHR